jgi:thioredoxin-related protein
MKFSFLLILLSLSLFAKVNAQVAPESTDKIMRAAYQHASKENKNVFVIFHASWCGWCRKMDSSINDPSVKSFFDNNYVFTHFIVYESKGKEALENPGALELLTKYGGNDQ